MASMIDRKDATKVLPMRDGLAPGAEAALPPPLTKLSVAPGISYGGGLHQLTLKVWRTDNEARREALAALRLPGLPGVQSPERAATKLLGVLASERRRKESVWHSLGLGGGTQNAASSEA